MIMTKLTKRGVEIQDGPSSIFVHDEKSARDIYDAIAFAFEFDIIELDDDFDELNDFDFKAF